MGLGGVALGAGLALQAAGSKEQAAQQQLSQAIENTGKSYDDFSGQIDNAVKKQETYGNTAADTKQALQILTQATHDPQKAFKLLNEASDLAAAMALTEAAGQLAKRTTAADGHSRAPRHQDPRDRHQAGSRGL